MTIKERILSVYNNQMPDKIPVSIYNRYHRYGEMERYARNTGLGILDFYPVVSLLAPPWHVKPGYFSEVKNAAFLVKVSWENGKPVETRMFETPVGTITQRISKDPSYGSNWITKHYLEDADDYKVMQYIVENTVFESQEQAILQRMDDLGEDGVVLGRIDRSPYQKMLIELADPQKFLVELMIHPEPIVELLETIHAKLEQQIEMSLNSRVEVIWSPDNVTADMTPPNAFEKYCLPFYQKHGENIKKSGKIYAVHMDGRTSGIKHLIARCPIDVIESFSFSEMSGDVTVSEAKEIWKDKVLCPNFPASYCEKSVFEIQAYLQRLLDDFGHWPFMIQISEDIPINSYAHTLQVLTDFFK